MIATIVWLYILMFGVALIGVVGALIGMVIVSLLRLLVFILPLLSVVALVVVLVTGLTTQPFLILGLVAVALIVLRAFKGRALLPPPQLREYGSVESRAEAAANLKTRTVLWWLAHD